MINEIECKEKIRNVLKNDFFIPQDKISEIIDSLIIAFDVYDCDTCKEQNRKDNIELKSEIEYLKGQKDAYKEMIGR